MAVSKKIIRSKYSCPLTGNPEELPLCKLPTHEDVLKYFSMNITLCLQSKHQETKKKGCNWIFVSHDVVSVDEIMKALDNHSGSAILKFEPFVLHTQCLSVEDAQKLHHCGIESGFKNSGISIGRTGKIIVAIRSTLSLEVPLSCNGALLVSKEYISFVVNACNDKMQNNWQRIERFYTRLQNTNSKGNSLSKKIPKVKPHESIPKDCDKDFMSKDVLLDTYYEGFHSLLNDTDG